MVPIPIPIPIRFTLSNHSDRRRNHRGTCRRLLQPLLYWL